MRFETVITVPAQVIKLKVTFRNSDAGTQERVSSY